MHSRLGKSDLELLGKGEESSRFALERAQVPQPDRRQSTRYSPTRDIACLGWWEGLQFQTVRVQLQNISLGGAGSPPGRYDQNRRRSGFVWQGRMSRNG